MKKLITLFLAFLLSFCAVASAEDLDLSSMNLDELVELHKLLDAEIDARIGGKPSLIAGGVYTAGKTIKSGMYAITCSDVYNEDGMTIKMFTSQSAYMLYQNDTSSDYYVHLSLTLQKGQTMSVSLSDGMVLVIDGGVGMAEAFMPTWAP